MKIAVDAMGGDYAPAEIIKGAVDGARRYGVGLILVGPEAVIAGELSRNDHQGLDIEILHTDQYLVEGEPAAYALRHKRNASIWLAVKQVRDGRAAAAIGIGPTGGVFSSAVQLLGMFEGLARPVIGAPLGLAPQTILIDMGGNMDNRPDQLLDFGVMAAAYARKWLDIPNPTVALLSNGKEEGKGNAVVKEAFALFQRSGLNFVGNVEGNDLALGRANVVVCDGFVGNCVMKFGEGIGTVTSRWWEERLRGKLKDEEIKELVAHYLQMMIQADTLGGGPLWGINGLVLKAHGRSKAPEVAMTVGTAKRAFEVGLVRALQAEVAAMRARLNVPAAPPAAG